MAAAFIKDAFVKVQYLQYTQSMESVSSTSCLGRVSSTTVYSKFLGKMWIRGRFLLDHVNMERRTPTVRVWYQAQNVCFVFHVRFSPI